MYRVYYTLTGGSVMSKEFDTINEAIKFSLTLPFQSVQEIKKIEKRIQKEDRT
jgi:hypothetical protein